MKIIIFKNHDFDPNHDDFFDHSPRSVTPTTNPVQARSITSYWTHVPIFVGREPSVTKL